MTRTSTEFPRLEPESSASTNSAMAAAINLKSLSWEKIVVFRKFMNYDIIDNGKGEKRMHESMKYLTEENFDKEIQSGLTLVDFYADWCGPCRMLTPILEKLSKEMKGKAVIAKIDIDKAQRVASDFQVTSIPTLVLFQGGKEIGRLVGLRDEETIKDFVLSSSGRK